ncbi:MAG: MATE family efflux transporter [Ruminococcaceae bacterium]|nr:MATE family efflux transporter [Oscillospiraceae bacterium]
MNLFLKTKNALIGDRNFYGKVFIIVFPIIIQNTVTNVVSLLDNVMVGRVGTLEMSAVAIVNQLIFVFALCIFGGLSGAGIFSAQYAGAKDNDGLRYCMRMKMYIGILMFLLSLFIFTVFSDNLICAYLAEDTPPEDAAKTLHFAKTYLSIMLVGLLPFTVAQVYSNSLREVGETRFPMIASVIAIVINLVFNYFLIFGKFGFPKLGVAGAAIATVISRYAEALVIVIYSHLKTPRYQFIKGLYRSFKIPFILCKKIIVSGLPLLVNEFLWSFGIAMMLQCYSVRSLSVVAAANISNTVQNLFNVAFISMGSAIAIMLGQVLGTGDKAKARDMCNKLLFVSVFVSIITAALMALLAKVIPEIYNTEPEVKKLAFEFLLVTAAIMPFNSYVHGCYFAIRSGGKTIITFLFDSFLMWSLNIPVAYILSNYTNLYITYVFLAVESIYIIKSIIAAILIKKGSWIRNIIN